MPWQALEKPTKSRLEVSWHNCSKWTILIIVDGALELKAKVATTIRMHRNLLVGAPHIEGNSLDFMGRLVKWVCLETLPPIRTRSPCRSIVWLSLDHLQPNCSWCDGQWVIGDQILYSLAELGRILMVQFPREFPTELQKFNVGTMPRLNHPCIRQVSAIYGDSSFGPEVWTNLEPYLVQAKMHPQKS